MRFLTLITLVSLFFLPQPATAQAIPENCVEANGLTWCYNPEACGEACNEVCAAVGGTPVADNDVWFQAQNSEEECQNISEAFGLGSSVGMETYTYACAEDNFGDHDAPGGLNAPLLCSTYAGCPANHRAEMDQLGIACGTASRRSICPCEDVSPVVPPTPVPLGSPMVLIFFVLALTAFAFTTIVRRREA